MAALMGEGSESAQFDRKANNRPEQGKVTGRVSLALPVTSPRHELVDSGLLVATDAWDLGRLKRQWPELPMSD
jgi:hypothetical protein